ncbi:HK97 gp10 family phage protein [Frigidibacter sp. MR17.24]|uniref:HK97 gp10 family phage protein n=1 Tax=Frigidibacter sp. MR17.24 TaxID=3127345 RepID=UPI003012EE21
MAGSFAKQVAAFTDKAKAKTDLAFRKIALDMFSEVILMSPVDTGRFRGNWQVAIGSVPEGTLQVDDKAGTATISKADAVTKRLVAGQTIYLVNNLPYAQRLEDGYSGQAPAGMVKITVQRFDQIVKAVGAEISRL